MKVRLLQNIKGMGQKGDIKEVSEGQARNMLFPKQLAEPATEQVLHEKIHHDKKVAQLKQEEVTTKRKRYDILNNHTVIIKSDKTPQGTLYKSVTKKIISEEILKTFKILVKEIDIELEDSIHKIGDYKISITCADGLIAKVIITIQ